METRQFRPISQPPHSTGKRYAGLRAAIDPRQVPSAIDTYLSDQDIWSNEPFLTCDTQRSIPLSTSDYNAVDQGNSSPRFIRSCTYAFPSSSDLAYTCEVPLAAVLQPFAEQTSAEMPVPLVTFGSAGPPRCEQCRAYINPWCIWTMSGQRWICNLCGKESDGNAMEAEYYSHLDASGRRVDLAKRPELSHGTVDFVVGKEYWAQPPPPQLLPSYSDDTRDAIPSASVPPRAPQAMCTLFVIDISQVAVASGSVQYICDAIQQLLYEVAVDANGNLAFAGRRVGFMTFSDSLHFYNVSSHLTTPEMLIVADLDDVFSPLRQNLFSDIEASRDIILKLLETIPKYAAETSTTTNTATGSALRGALAAMIDTGGQVLLFQSALPNFGLGALSTRDEVSLYGTDKEKTLFRPQDVPASWSDLGDEFAGAGVGLTIFLFPKQYVDVASVGAVAYASGGEVFYHPKFDFAHSWSILLSEMRRVAVRETGYNTSIIVRVSSGLRVSTYQGNFSIPVTSDSISIGTLDADKAFTVTFAHEKTLESSKDVYIQCAVLYTSTNGERRVRSCNIALGVATLAGNVFRYADIDAVMSVMTKDVLLRLPSQPLSSVKEALTQQVASILLAYRKQCAASSSPGQLIIPEALKILPLYALSLLKTKAIKGNNVVFDVRNHDAHRMLSMSVAATISYLYPRVYAVHDLQPYVGIPDEVTGWIPLPSPQPASHLWMEAHGAYLLDDGEATMLWLGRGISPQILQDLFGVDNLDEVPRTSQLPDRPNSLLSVQLQNIMKRIEEKRGGRAVPFTLVRQNMDGAEIEFGDLLVEDQNNDAMSYTDYICHVHKLISTALADNTSVGGSSIWTKLPWT